MPPPSFAPEFPPGLTWIPVDAPLAMRRDLLGHVVLLHFWTSGSVHCRQVLQTLACLEQVYAGEPFTVVGVHTGKFQRERMTGHVRDAVAELGLRHPVVVDDGMQIWRSYACTAWPTLVLVDGTGRIRFSGTGTPRRAKLVAAVGSLLRELPPGARQERAHSLRMPAGPEGPLRWPGKVAVDPARHLVWISDTGNHRIVGAEMDGGLVRHVIGSGLAGASDGPFASACFFAPQGICVLGDELFVADAGNHRIRRVDLRAATVGTLVGKGFPVADIRGGAAGLEQGLSSPWDLCARGEELFVAMAGANQVWRVDARGAVASAYAGNGALGLLDGGTSTAQLAQPSGIACHADRLAFVDAETSALREVDLASGEVKTLLGRGMFAYGDLDGPCGGALLQHPLGVAFHRDDLLIADTYNDKVKRLDREKGRVETLLGRDAGLVRPGGIAVHEDLVFVADTGSHRILRIDLAAGRSEVLRLGGLASSPGAAGGALAAAGPVVLAANGEAKLQVELRVPSGARVHPDAVLWAELENDSGAPLGTDLAVAAEVLDGKALVRGVPCGEPGEGTFRLRLSYATSHGDEQVCHPHELRWVVRAQLVEAGPDAATIELEEPGAAATVAAPVDPKEAVTAVYEAIARGDAAACARLPWLAGASVEDCRVRSLLHEGERMVVEATLALVPAGGAPERHEELHLWTLDGLGRPVDVRRFVAP